MRRKIQEMIRGIYTDERPVLQLVDEASLDFSIVEGEPYEGSFLVKSSGAPIRGIVCCTHPLVRIDTPEFESDKALIRFTFQGDGVREGQEQQGRFILTTDAGEYVYPFFATVTRHYIRTSIGRIKTLNDFANLCKLNWEEALGVFSSPHFCNIFHENAEYYTLLYRALTHRQCTAHEMEEFLVASEKKQRGYFCIDHPNRTYIVRDKSVQVAVGVEKSQWGHCLIRIFCDAPFVSIEKDTLTTDDFFGKQAEFSVRIDPEKLHQGKNMTQITLDAGFQTETLNLTCIKKERQADQLRLAIVPEEAGKRSSSWQRRLVYYRLERLYLDFVLQKKSEREWIYASIDMIQKAEQPNVPNYWLILYLAYLCWRLDDTGRMEECMHLIPRNIRGAKSPLAGIYLYLTYLNDRISKTETLSRLADIMIRYRNHPILTLIVLRLDDSYTRNPARKYDFLRQYLTEESISPLFLAEAAQLLCTNPELLNSQDAFDFRLVRWMAKKNLLTRELSLRIEGMANSMRTFNKGYVRLLSKCYKKFGDESIVKTICVYLIKTSNYGPSYFPWFKRGVEQQLRIAGLYEGYLLCWSRGEGELPPQVIRYFSKGCSLPTKKTAMLYAYIVRNKRRLETEWPLYREQVESFAVKQLAKGTMSDDLAIIYEDVRRGMAVSDWNAVKADAESCYKVYIEGAGFVAVQVAQWLTTPVLDRRQVTDDSAFVYLYRTPYVVLYEAKNGLAYAPAGKCRMSKLLPGNNLYSTQGEPERTEDPADSADDLNKRLERLERMSAPISELCAILFEAKKRLLPILAPAQQLLIRMLFCEELTPEHEQLFDLIRHDAGSKELIAAYISFLCHRSVTGGEEIPFAIYDTLGMSLRKGQSINDDCRAAFLKAHLSYQKEEYASQAEKLLQTYIFAGAWQPFVSQLPEKIQRKYLLFDECTREDSTDDFAPGASRDEMLKTLMKQPENEALLMEYARLCDMTEALFLPVK